MCGICGIFDMRNERRFEKETIYRMAEMLKHRGPDMMEHYLVDNIALGFTRLSIVDLEGGKQPITNEDGMVVLVCNGEIYNYRELRKELEQKGHVFKTNCDIEIILHLYEEDEINFVDKLNGQFAFALYDIRKKQLFCGRDHTGIAPFFYTLVDGLFIFASEIKAILEHPSIRREVDLIGLDQILTFPGLVSPRTLFKNIQSLESGHCLLVKDGRIENIEYWDLTYPKTDELIYTKDEDYYIEKLDELITKSVKYRLQADVPVGFYISGGLDSSLIAAKIKQVDESSHRHSFSIDFVDKNISESKYQRLMANHVQSIHHEKLFQFSDITERLQKVIWYSECALKETYNTASLALSESVRNQDIKVVLTGEGADELFGGYVGYRFDKLRQAQSASSTDILEDKMRKKIWGDDNFLYEKNYHSYQLTKQQLYSDRVNHQYNNVDCSNYPIINQEKIANVDIFHKRSYVDFKLRMSDHLLADHGDRMAYANSVEARYPFLDKNIIEFAKCIPVHLKLKDFTEKYILKKVAEKIVPKEIIQRPKFAFVAPSSSELLKQNNEYINDLLSYEKIKQQGYFNPNTVENLRKKYSEPGFKLNVPYDDDLLIIVITFGIFLDLFKMPALS